MISAYKAFRLKQEKAGKTNEAPDQPEKKNPNHPDAVSEFAQKFIKKINGIDTKDWSTDEWEQIRTAFTGIKDQIDAFLNSNLELS